MKNIYRTISDVILPAVVFAALMAILIGASLFGKIGKRMEVSGEDFSVMEDSQEVQRLCHREEPVIQCVGKKLWNVGECISVTEIFTAVDAEDKAVDVIVRDITNQEGVSVMECYRSESRQASFAQRGVYTFLLEAVDAEQKAGRKRFSILVDNR